MIFNSDRLNYRPIDSTDMDELFSIWGDKETMRFCGGVMEKEKIAQIIEDICTQYNRYGNGIFAVMKNAQIVGICGGKLDEDNPHHVELVLHLKNEYQHQGFGPEALKAYIEWLRSEKKATLVYASVHPDNRASLSMAKKCGLIPTGFRQYEDTGFVDEPYFELLLD